MFFQCPKCKKVWQYPIEKCPDCFSKLERLKSKKLKVIGISRVTIPTILHPEVPYFVLLLEDENKNKFVQKSTPHRTRSPASLREAGRAGAGSAKEYKIGDEFKIEIAKSKSSVAIWRVKYDIFAALEKVIDLIGGIEINQDSKILILPTLISPTHPHFSQNTRPEVLNNLIKFLIEKGVNRKNIVIAAQSFTDFPIEASFKKSRLLEVSLKNEVQVLDLSKKGFRKIEKSDSAFDVSEVIFENDLIINLPILKLDSKLGVKGALANLTKLFKKESLSDQKYLLGEEKLLLELKKVLPACAEASAGRPEILTIADGGRIQKTDGMSAFLGIILASFNPLNLDRVFAEISEIRLPEYLKSIKIEEIEIVGRQLKEIRYELDKA